MLFAPLLAFPSCFITSVRACTHTYIIFDQKSYFIAFQDVVYDVSNGLYACLKGRKMEIFMRSMRGVEIFEWQKVEDKFVYLIDFF